VVFAQIDRRTGHRRPIWRALQHGFGHRVKQKFLHRTNKLFPLSINSLDALAGSDTNIRGNTDLTNRSIVILQVPHALGKLVFPKNDRAF